MIARTTALAFGVMKATDLLKQVFERATGMTLQPYLKSTASIVLTGAVTSLYAESWRERLELGAGVAGLAAVLHEGEQLLATGADRNKVMVINQAARAAVSSMGTTAPGRRVQPL